MSQKYVMFLESTTWHGRTELQIGYPPVLQLMFQKIKKSHDDTIQMDVLVRVKRESLESVYIHAHTLLTYTTTHTSHYRHASLTQADLELLNAVHILAHPLLTDTTTAAPHRQEYSPLSRVRF